MSENPNPQAESAPADAGEKSLDTLLAEAQARIEEQRDAHLRAVAEAENIRKRAQVDIAAAHKFGVERLAEGLLPVMDSLEAAMLAKDVSAIEITFKQLKTTLEKANVKDISPVPGDKFDPHRHQAMAAVEAADAAPNSIVAVVLRGYSLHDRVIRPALVTVAKALENQGGNPISDSNLNTN